MTVSNRWQSIIWREWRHSADPLYADRLFKVVGDQSLGWRARASVILLNAVGGAALGILVGLLFTSSWATLRHMVWLGGLLGIIYGWVQARRYTWRDWLERLSANTPTGSFSRLVLALVAMGLIGGMMFGPIFWLAAAGLFWAFGEVITWVNRGITTGRQDRADERRWWFWWGKRPRLLEVEQALQQACLVSPAARELWQYPLRRLAEERERMPTTDMLIEQLLSADWLDRFVARHILVQRGSEAIFPLQTVVHNNSTPDRAALVWLLEALYAESGADVRSPAGSDRSY